MTPLAIVKATGRGTEWQVKGGSIGAHKRV